MVLDFLKSHADGALPPGSHLLVVLTAQRHANLVPLRNANIPAAGPPQAADWLMLPLHAPTPACAAASNTHNIFTTACTCRHVRTLCARRYMHRVHIPTLARPRVQAGVLALFLTSEFIPSCLVYMSQFDRIQCLLCPPWLLLGSSSEKLSLMHLIPTFPSRCTSLWHAALILSLVAAPRLSVGLDQAVALPRDSYLQHYFRFADCFCFLPAARLVGCLSCDCWALWR